MIDGYREQDGCWNCRHMFKVAELPCCELRAKDPSHLGLFGRDLAMAKLDAVGNGRVHPHGICPQWAKASQ